MILRELLVEADWAPSPLREALARDLIDPPTAPRLGGTLDRQVLTRDGA